MDATYQNWPSDPAFGHRCRTPIFPLSRTQFGQWPAAFESPDNEFVSRQIVLDLAKWSLFCPGHILAGGIVDDSIFKGTTLDRQILHLQRRLGNIMQIQNYSSPCSTRPATPNFDLPSCDTSFDGEEDEHTLSAFGDISLSNTYFVPGLPSAVSPRRDDSWIKDDSKQTPPPSVRKISALNIEVSKESLPFIYPYNFSSQHPLPSVIKNILPPSPSAAAISPGTDFARMVERLRDSRISEKNPPHPGLALPSPSKPIHAPQPRHAVNLKAIDNLKAKVNPEGAPPRSVKDRGLFRPTARLSAPKPKEKPFRGGRLPIRPPLPRWELHDPLVAQTDLPRALYGGPPAQVMSRT
ncbi:hypothetical protein FPV67DRAFT_515864 [Lyophyllum atratum]|nr:hypothetical protein FPV67DRAFT_515864 [Lyophyllum atratum]